MQSLASSSLASLASSARIPADALHHRHARHYLHLHAHHRPANHPARQTNAIALEGRQQNGVFYLTNRRRYCLAHSRNRRPRSPAATPAAGLRPPSPHTASAVPTLLTSTPASNETAIGRHFDAGEGLDHLFVKSPEKSPAPGTRARCRMRRRRPCMAAMAGFIVFNADQRALAGVRDQPPKRRCNRASTHHRRTNGRLTLATMMMTVEYRRGWRRSTTADGKVPPPMPTTPAAATFVDLGSATGQRVVTAELNPIHPNTIRLEHDGGHGQAEGGAVTSHRQHRAGGRAHRRGHHTLGLGQTFADILPTSTIGGPGRPSVTTAADTAAMAQASPAPARIGAGALVVVG